MNNGDPDGGCESCPKKAQAGDYNLAANSVKSRVLLAAFGISYKILPYFSRKQIINEAKGFTNFATEDNFKQLIDQIVPGLPLNW